MGWEVWEDYGGRVNGCRTPPLPSLDQEPQTELAAQLAQEFYNVDMPLHLVNNLGKLDFEVGTPPSLSPPPSLP